VISEIAVSPIVVGWVVALEVLGCEAGTSWAKIAEELYSIIHSSTAKAGLKLFL
jgi:hypothetical protein